MPYAKPFLTIQQQLALLQRRGLQITDVSKANACLGRIGYYRLSGYLHSFRESQVVKGPNGAVTTQILDNYRAGTDLQTIVDLYIFDKKLRLLMLDAMERIEVALRVEVATLLGARSGWAHRDPAQLNQKFVQTVKPGSQLPQHKEWVRRIDDTFARSKEDFVKHFKSKYAGAHLPIWMSIELWEFGTLSVFFGGMLGKDKNTIAQKYGVPLGLELETWLRNLNVCRNICAHHSRLWNKPSVIQMRLPAAKAAPELAHIIGNTHAQTRVYGSALIAAYLLRSINPTSSWCQRFVALTNEFPQTPHISLAQAGFPAGWHKESIWN